MFDDLSRTEIEYLIGEWIRGSRNREIVKSRIIDKLTFEKLAEVYDLSVTQAKAIVKESQIILLKHKTDYK